MSSKQRIVHLTASKAAARTSHVFTQVQDGAQPGLIRYVTLDNTVSNKNYPNIVNGMKGYRRNHTEHSRNIGLSGPHLDSKKQINT